MTRIWIPLKLPHIGLKRDVFPKTPFTPTSLAGRRSKQHEPFRLNKWSSA
jgi:hypothetical protein